MLAVVIGLLVYDIGYAACVLLLMRSCLAEGVLWVFAILAAYPTIQGLIAPVGSHVAVDDGKAQWHCGLIMTCVYLTCPTLVVIVLLGPA